MEKWTGQELEFVAPEMYWHGDASPAADVYSLALLVIYGLGEGKLPFETVTSSGQLARMSGKTLPAPKSAGKRLAEVLEKATAFQAKDRYQSPEELQIMLESCMDNKYLGGSSGGEAVFKKEETDLSDIERMMVDIIEAGSEPEEKVPEEAGSSCADSARRKWRGWRSRSPSARKRKTSTPWWRSFSASGRREPAQRPDPPGGRGRSPGL